MGDSYVWGAAASGGWDLASNWIDTTTGQDPAPAAPGANDDATIDAAAGGSTRVITGTGDSASLSIAGPTLLSGQFTTGTFDFDGAANPDSNADLALNAGDTLTVTGSATVDKADFGGFDIGGGAATIEGDLAFDAYSSVNAVSDGGVLSVAGTITSSFPGVSISGTTGARIQLASVSGAINLSVDSASSLEIGAAGGAALGAVTVDSGTSVTLGGPSEEPTSLTAPSIVDDGAIAAAAGASLSLDGGLAGSGQVDIGAGSNLTVESVDAASQNTIDFTGAGGVLTILGSALNASEAFLPTIVGFNASDAIDFEEIATSASYAAGALTLYDGTTAIATLTVSGDYAGETFDARALASGTQIDVLGQGDTATPPAGTSVPNRYAWGSGIAGSWDLASSWSDATTGQDPASAAPGANDDVTIDAAAGGATHVITGTGDSASLSIAGATLLSGQFTTGTFDFNGAANPDSNADLALNAGDTLTVTGSASVDNADFGGFDIGGGAMTIDGDLAFDAYSSVNAVSDGGLLTVAGTVTSPSPYVSISGTTGARIQLGSVSGAICLSVDSASSLEIGAAGGGALGAITVDSGASATFGGPSEEPSCLTAPSIVDDGDIAVIAGESLTLNGGLAGSGQIDIGAGSNLTVEGVEAASQNAIDFTGAGGVLTILGSALNASDVFLPAIGGFNASDAIDFAGTATSASYAGGALTLYDGTAAVATLELSGDYNGEVFTTFPASIEDGLASGAQISLDPNSGNEPPAIQAPREETVSSGKPSAISNLGIADSASGASLSVTLSDSGGLLTVTTNAPGGGGAVTGSGGETVTIAGTLAQINADLQTLAYQNSTLGSDNILVSANDGLGGVTDAEISVAVTSISASDAIAAYTANSTSGPFAIVDSAPDIGENLYGLETLATAAELVSIVATGGPVIASASASSADAGVLGEIGGFDVSDMAANVAANIDALNADANVAAILLVDFATPALALDVAQAIGDTTALGEIASPYTIAIADTAANVSANHAAIATWIDEGKLSSLTRTDVAGQAYSSYAELYDDGADAGTDYFFTGVAGEPYSAYEYDYSAGNARIASKFDYTGITGQAYTGEEVDYDGAGLLTSAAFTGVTGAAYSAYQYDYVGGIFSGSQFTFATVPAGATYSSYETDYNQANAFTGDSFFFTNVQGQGYTGEEADFDAEGALSSVRLTGIVDQAYSSLTLDYSAGTYEGYQACYTAITGQSFTGEEVGVSAAGRLEKVVYSGMTSTPYSSVEEDYSGSALADVIYNFTNVTGASYNSYQVEENAGGAALQETFDLNRGGHDLIALADGQTLTSLGDDTMTGDGSTTFVLNAVYGADTIANLTSGDIVSMPDSEFSSFAALSAAASFGTGAAVITAGDRDTLTLKGVTTSAQLQGLSGDFTFHG